MADYKVTNPARGVWAIDENGGVTLYLIAGTQRAVLLDTGFDGIGLPELVASLTELPVQLVHTHVHGDHTMGDAPWSACRIHASEAEELIGQGNMRAEQITPLQDGDCLELGGRRLEVIHTPGHSPGSVCLLDAGNRLLFSGDTVMCMAVPAANPNSSPADLSASLQRLLARRGEFDTIFPSHDVFPIGLAELEDLARAAARAAAGEEPDAQFASELMVPGGTIVLRSEGFREGRMGVTVRNLGEAPQP